MNKQNSIQTMVKQVLLIGGDKAQSRLLSGHLTELGYKTVLARNAGQAKLLLTQQVFDLILLNATLPDLDGLKLLKHIKNDLTLGYLPVVVISTPDEFVPLETYLEVGADDFLQLPCLPRLLHNRLKAYLQQRQLNDLMPLYQKELEHLDKLARDLFLVILPLGVALSAEKDFNKLLERILREAKTLCNADGGTLYLMTEDDSLDFMIMLNDTLNIATGGATGEKTSFPPPLPLYDKTTRRPNLYTVSTHAAIQGHSINIPNIYNNEEFDFSGTRALDLQRDYHTISSLTIPLKSYDSLVIGVLQLINAKDPETNRIIPFDTYQQQVVEALASQAAIVLNNQILVRRHQELVKFERELKIAREIQKGFLPDVLPQPTGWEIAARFQPAHEVAGDFYDAFYLANKRWVGIVVADVCDKGTKAALFMALIRSLIRAYSEQHSSMHGLRLLSTALLDEDDDFDTGWTVLLTSGMILQMTVELVNNYILQNHIHQNMFATLFFGLFDPKTRLLSYINGGHNPPVIIGPDGIKQRLNPTGPAIGLHFNVKIHINQITLLPGDTLFAYTDGITDARNPAGVSFTQQHLLSLLDQPTSSATELLDRIEKAVQVHTAEANQFDDITMLAVRLNGD